MKKSIFILLLIGCCTSNVFAESSTFLVLDKNSTKDKMQEFYCTATGVDTKVFLQNFGQMVKGFNQKGSLFIKPNVLNKVYFQAYHDPKIDYSLTPGFIIAATTGNGTITCDYGNGGKNRELISGDFG